MNNIISSHFIEVSRLRANYARDRINHCIDQLDNNAVWWSPTEECNSIGIILQHLHGNIRQWIISGIGKESDIRNRPMEFLVQEKLSKLEIRDNFNVLMDSFDKILATIDNTRLLEEKRIQGSNVTILGAIYVVLTHLELHAGQISYITRMKLGKAYKFYWVPTTKEEGV